MFRYHQPAPRNFRFKWGDRVQLKSGGPMMLVVDILKDDRQHQKLEVAYRSDGCTIETPCENAVLKPYYGEP